DDPAGRCRGACRRRRTSSRRSTRSTGSSRIRPWRGSELLPARALTAHRNRFEAPRQRVGPWHPKKERIMGDDGVVDDAKGRIKEAAGDLTGDQGLKNEGKVDRASGKVKDAVGDV